MTGNQLLNTSLKILGYTDQNGNSQLTAREQELPFANINSCLFLIYGVLQTIHNLRLLPSLGDTINLYQVLS